MIAAAQLTTATKPVYLYNDRDERTGYVGETDMIWKVWESPDKELHQTSEIADTGETKMPEVHSEKHAPNHIREAVQDAFRRANYIVFEYGMDNEFCSELTEIIEQYGGIAANAIRDVVFSPGVNPEVAFEALRFLGEVEHPPSYRRRLVVLITSLKHDSTWVRDGAGLGLASMSDRRAIHWLTEAINSERVPELKEDLQRVLTQLQEV